MEALNRQEGLRKSTKIQCGQYPGTDSNQAPTALLLRQSGRYMYSANKLIIAHMVRKFVIYRNPETYLQGPANGPYSEPYSANPHLKNLGLFLKGLSEYYLPIYPSLPFLQGFD
jgi:hypothetical protein